MYPPLKAEDVEVTEEPAEIPRDDTPKDTAVDVEDTESACPIVPCPGKQGGLVEGGCLVGTATSAVPSPLPWSGVPTESTQPSMVEQLAGDIETRPAVEQPE